MNDDTQLDRYSSKHVYEQIADAMEVRIRSGYYAIKLPGERDLAEEFGVSYLTARHAMALLREREIILSVHGRGTLVAPDYREHPA